MSKKNYKTISSEEMKRIENLEVQSLHRYQGLFHRIVDGRSAALEFFEIQDEIIPGFVLDVKLKDQIVREKTFFAERLDAINQELDRRGFNKFAGIN
jgi:hypothetical protein